jgi:hypothetical protein
MASSGIASLDTLTGGLPRGCLTEICGPASSGCTSIMLAAIAAATRRGEFCALVDASDALDPQSAAAAGVDLKRLLWVRCGEDLPRKHKPYAKSHVAPDAPVEGMLRLPRTSYESEHRLEQLLRATDLLLESGGFGLIVLDLADLPAQSARRIPLTTWFRFRRAVEHKPTILLTIEQQPIAGSCSSLVLQLGTPKRHNHARCLQIAAPEGRKKFPVRSEQENWDVETNPTHAHLLSGLQINVEQIRSRLDRKPTQSATFETKTAWAG